MVLASASDCCMGEKFEDLVVKTCHLVISDIKNGLSGVCRNFTRGTKKIAEGSEHRNSYLLQ